MKRNSKEKRELIKPMLFTGIGSVILLSNILVNPINHYVSGLILLFGAIVLYFLMAITMCEKNWLDIRAVFAGGWLATIGLAALRLADYQEAWQNRTWICLALIYLVFELGSNLGLYLCNKWMHPIKEKINKFNIGRLHFEKQENRLFGICVVTTLIGLACFSVNVAIKGFIPCFSNSTTAYTDFYTKFHVFAVASTGVSGLCFYTVKTQKISKFKKFVLLLCIFYLVFLFPIMVVSRGVFLVAAVSLTVVVFYLYKRRIIALLLCVVTMLSIYLFTSELRNYTEQQLSNFFEPTQIVVNPVSEVEGSEGIQSSDDIVIQLSPKMSFVYSYLTVGFDNFNEAIQNAQHYTYGIRQLRPINVLFRIKKINDINNKAEFYKIRPHFNTVCFGGEFYYDLREAGICIFTLLWAMVFGCIQQFYAREKGIFSLMTLGNAMVPVLLGFFDAWVTTFAQWMLWGVVLLFALAVYVRIYPKEELCN